MMEISIVIPTYNRTNILIECLKLLNEQTAPRDSFEVIVVEDGSDDCSKEKILSLEKNYSFKYLYQENQGQAGARNNGIHEACGRIILFIDDDVLAHPALVKTHLRLQKDQTDLIVRGPVINIPYLKIPITRPPGFWDMSRNFFCTSNASVPKEHILDVSMFDTEFRWWEDADLGFRLRMKGLKWKFSLQAVVYHYKPSDESLLTSIKKLSITKGKYAVKLCKKHPHWRIKLATGIYGPKFLSYRNSSLINFYKNIINSKKTSSFYSPFLISQIGSYYYYKTIQEELEKK